MTTRTDAVKLRGNPVTLVGNELKSGQPRPDFKLQDTGMQEVSLATSSGKTRIIATIPSLDTPVCAMETKKFNEQAGQLSNVEVLVVSMDLPFGQKRWCGAENVASVKTLERPPGHAVRRRLRRADSGRPARPLPGPGDLRRRRPGKAEVRGVREGHQRTPELRRRVGCRQVERAFPGLRSRDLFAARSHAFGAPPTSNWAHSLARMSLFYAPGRAGGGTLGAFRAKRPGRPLPRLVRHNRSFTIDS